MDQFEHDNTLLVVALVLFVLIFEFGPGPICWIYLAEVMNEKGVAVATSLIGTFTLIYSSLFPLCLNNPSVMYVLCAPCGFASLLIYFYMKETKDLTEQQLMRLYRSDILKTIGDLPTSAFSTPKPGYYTSTF